MLETSRKLEELEYFALQLLVAQVFVQCAYVFQKCGGFDAAGVVVEAINGSGASTSRVAALGWTVEGIWVLLVWLDEVGGGGRDLLGCHGCKSDFVKCELVEED